MVDFGAVTQSYIGNIDFDKIKELLPPSSQLPTVKDPDKAYADLLRREYDDYVNNYRETELELINRAQSDTSLIDQAKADAPAAAALTRGIQQRNLERYGGDLTAAQTREMGRSLQRGNTLGAIQSVNDARIAQQETNSRILSNLINIGQGVNATAQDQLGTSANNAVQLRNAYSQARANSKAQTYNTIGQLAGTAAMLLVMSDRRVKKNIKKVGESPSGVSIYNFEYLNNNDVYQGVMADEVPWATHEGPNGYMAVDYNKVDVEFKKVS